MFLLVPAHPGSPDKGLLNGCCLLLLLLLLSIFESTEILL